MNERCPCRFWPELMRERRHLHGCLSHRDFLLRLAPRRLGAILCAKAAEAVFASRAGSSLRDARLSQALFFPPPSRPHAECVTRRRRGGRRGVRPRLARRQNAGVGTGLFRRSRHQRGRSDWRHPRCDLGHRILKLPQRRCASRGECGMMEAVNDKRQAHGNW